MELIDAVRPIVARALRMPVDEITDELSIEKTKAWDSMAHVDIVVGIELRSGIALSQEEIVAMRTVAEIVRILESRGVTASNLASL